MQNQSANKIPSIFAWMMYQEKRSYEKNQFTHVCSRRNNSDELFALYGAEFKGDFYHAVQLLRRGRETASRNLHSETTGGRAEHLRGSEYLGHARGTASGTT